MVVTYLRTSIGALALAAALALGVAGTRPAEAAINRVGADYTAISDGTSNTLTTARVVVNHEEQY
jgi:hypothetical protein